MNTEITCTLRSCTVWFFSDVAENLGCWASDFFHMENE